MMKSIELDEKLKVLYKSTKKEPFFVNVPYMNYITYRGTGHPSENDFQKACEILFPIAYTIKFKIVKTTLNIDYKVNPMEIDWFLDKNKGKTSYSWLMMIMQPKFVTKKMYKEAIAILKESEKNLNCENAAFESIKYGKCIQCFHFGDYKKMNNTLTKMTKYGKTNGYETEPFTHDVYLNDSRKTNPENLKTIMRVKIFKK